MLYNIVLFIYKHYYIMMFVIYKHHFIYIVFLYKLFYSKYMLYTMNFLVKYY